MVSKNQKSSCCMQNKTPMLHMDKMPAFSEVSEKSDFWSSCSTKSAENIYVERHQSVQLLLFNHSTSVACIGR